MIIIGLDGATWKVIDKNLDKLKTIKFLKERYKWGTIYLKYKPLSPAIWTSMFSGVSPYIHNHWDFVNGDKLIKREDIPVEFIWDILYKKGYDVYVFNLPITIPTYNFNVDFKPIGYGLPITEEECILEIKSVTEKAMEILEKEFDLLIFVYTALDRYSHLNWNSDKLVMFYKMIDDSLGSIFKKYRGDFILISDHGFTDLESARIRTLKRYENIKGEHDIDAIYLTNLNVEINKPEDVFHILKEYFKT